MHHEKEKNSRFSDPFWTSKNIKVIKSYVRRKFLGVLGKIFFFLVERSAFMVGDSIHRELELQGVLIAWRPLIDFPRSIGALAPSKLTSVWGSNLHFQISFSNEKKSCKKNLDDKRCSFQKKAGKIDISYVLATFRNINLLLRCYPSLSTMCRTLFDFINYI